MPPLAIEFSPRFRAGARSLPAEQQQEVAAAAASLAKVFGQPHLHSGLGIRRLIGQIYEFRVGRDLRVVFEVSGSNASFLIIGTHQEVRRFLKNR